MQVAWLLNLRGSDVPCCPVLQAYVLVEAEGGCIFVDGAKLPAAPHAQTAPAWPAAAHAATHRTGGLPAGSRHGCPTAPLLHCPTAPLLHCSGPERSALTACKAEEQLWRRPDAGPQSAT